MKITFTNREWVGEGERVRKREKGGRRERGGEERERLGESFGILCWSHRDPHL